MAATEPRSALRLVGALVGMPLAGVLLTSVPASAQVACYDATAGTGIPASSEMCNLGTLSGGTRSYAVGVSADGSVVVGMSDSSFEERAFRWVSGTGMEDLGTLSGGTYSGAYGVNADGSVVVGQSDNGSEWRAFRWVSGTGMEDLGTLSGGTYSHAYGVNSDGSVVVGYSDSSSGSRAFRWVSGTGMEDLGTLSGGTWSGANGVSADGSVVVGQSDSSSGDRAFRWDAGTGMEDLGTLSGGTWSYATRVSSDGNVVAGTSDSSSGSRAFRWVFGTGMEDLGTLSGGTYSHANGMSPDGNVIVGWSNDRAFRWDSVSGMVDIGALSGGTVSDAIGVNSDGSVVVGWSGSSVGVRAFVWRTYMQDLENLVGSFDLLVNDTDLAITQQQDSTATLADQACRAGAGERCVRSTLSTGRTGATSADGIGARGNAAGLLSMGYGATESLTLGATVSFGGDSLSDNAFDLDPGFGGALWAHYSADGPARTGWQGEMALGFGQASGAITRGRGLTDVLLSTGEASMSTQVARARLAYGFERASGWLLTPSLGLSQFRTHRDGYAESGGDFNATYDALTTNRTTLDVALSAETALSERSRLTLSGGVSHDLAGDSASLSGTSDLPVLTTFAVDSSLQRHDLRPFLLVGYGYDAAPGGTISGALRLAQPAFGTAPSASAVFQYEARF